MTHRAIRFLLRHLLRWLFRVEVHGLEHYPLAPQRLLLIANHNSYLDAWLLALFLPQPLLLVGRSDNRCYWPLQQLPERAGDTNYLRELVTRLERGERLLMFPESQISPHGYPTRTNTSAAVVAAKAQATVLGIAIDGLQYSRYAPLQTGVTRHWFPKVRLCLIPPRRLRVKRGLKASVQQRQLKHQLEDLLRDMTVTGVDPRATLVTALVTTAQRYGWRRPAISDEHGSLDYRQLLQLGLLWRTRIRRHGQHGAAALWLAANRDSLGLFLASQFNGHASVILPPNAPARTLLSLCLAANVNVVYSSRQFVANHHLEDTVAVLSQSLQLLWLEDLRSRLPFWQVALVGLLSYCPDLAHRYWNPRHHGDRAAAVIASAGHGGPPRAILLGHRNLIANIQQVRYALALSPNDRVLACLPLGYSPAGMTHLLLPLLSGSCLCLAADNTSAVAHRLHRHQVTVLLAPSTALDHYGRQGNPFDFFSLRLVLGCGEGINPASRQLWQERLGLRLYEVYGIAEAGVVAINGPRHYRPLGTGRLLPGIDFTLESVGPTGGRLQIRSPSTMLGYLSSAQPGQCLPLPATRSADWCDTGDWAQVDDDGFITLQGRVERYAWIGGERVSLAQLEELAYTLWPDDQHAALSLVTPDQGEQLVLLTTYYQASRHALLQAAQEQGIADNLVPQQLIVVSELPSTDGGRLNRHTVRRLAEALLTLNSPIQH